VPKRKSWRDVYPVHPAADVFPLMSEEELTELAQDIKKNGLQTPILLWEEVTEAPKEVGDKRKKGKVYVLDGRNRLDALEKLGLPLLTEKGEFTNTGISSKGIYKWKRVISSKEFFWGMGNLEGRPSVKHASDPATISPRTSSVGISPPLSAPSSRRRQLRPTGSSRRGFLKRVSKTPRAAVFEVM
jgi:hypothetical protein